MKTIKVKDFLANHVVNKTLQELNQRSIMFIPIEEYESLLIKKDVSMTFYEVTENSFSTCNNSWVFNPLEHPSMSWPTVNMPLYKYFCVIPIVTYDVFPYPGPGVSIFNSHYCNVSFLHIVGIDSLKDFETVARSLDVYGFGTHRVYNDIRVLESVVCDDSVEYKVTKFSEDAVKSISELYLSPYDLMENKK